jgi:putative FmdB family regulatory protein|tara:strand:+ start:228 stop:530 length:303 start_codon:yes stop_codon:yes gene_type:complete
MKYRRRRTDMPLYQYKCKDCESYIDNYQNRMVRGSEDSFVGSSCPLCHNGELERVVTLPHAIVRGGGDWATAIRKDQVDFSNISMEDSLGRISSNKTKRS